MTNNSSDPFERALGQAPPETASFRTLRRFLPLVDFCVVDLETTGMNPYQGAEIIEIGAVRLEDGELSGTFHQLVEPRRPVPGFITELTGITNNMVSGQPSVDDVLPSFVEFAGDAVLIAHNFRFDFSFLNRYYHESFYNDHICTVKMARNVANFESNSLDDLVPRLNLDREDAHRALDDALATGELFRILSEKVTEPHHYHRAGVPTCLHQLDPGALAMNVRGVGKQKGRRIARAFDSSRDLLDASGADLRRIEGIGPELAAAIDSFTRNFTPAAPGRNTPLTLDSEPEPEYDEHHRDRSRDVDDLMDQTGTSGR